MNKNILQKILFFSIILIKFNLFSQINLDWAKTISTAGPTYGKSIIANNNLYITGGFNGTVDFDPSVNIENLTSNGGSDVFIAKYDINGNYQWAISFGGSSNESSYGLSIDGDNNIIISGSFQNTIDFDPSSNIVNLTSAGSSDIFIAKYDANGNYIWAQSFGDFGADLGAATVIDSNNNIFLCGTFWGNVDFDYGPSSTILNTTTGNGVYLAKYTTAGNLIWAKKIVSDGTNNCYSLVLDNNENVYTTGSFIGTADFDASINVSNLTSVGQDDIFLTKYDASGSFIWAKKLGGVGIDFGYGLICDMTNHLIVTGTFESTADFDPSSNTTNLTSNGSTDIFLAKYDSNGNYIWAKSTGGPMTDVAYNIITDNVGNIYETGRFDGNVDFDPSLNIANLSSAGNYDIFLSKYDSNGNYLFAEKFGNTNLDMGSSITLDNVNNIYIYGWFNGTVDFDPSTNVSSLTSVGGTNGFFAKYNSSSQNIKDLSENPILCYPNPNDGKVTLQLKNPTNSLITITNALGVKVFQKEFNYSDTITFEFEVDTGIYFLNYESENEKYFVKLVKR